MRTIAKIALTIPNSDRPGRYFSFRLKSALHAEPSVYVAPKKLLAISDIEGNFQPFCRLLLKNKVIDRYFNWIFEDGHLVIVGDCFDRGEQVMECLWLIYMLEEKAEKSGGKVHFILGNHEIMNLNGDWRYVHPKYATLVNTDKLYTALYDGNSELWRWLLTKNIMEIIGNILFVHGGIAKDLVDLNIPIEEINERTRPYYARANQTFTDPLLQLVFNSNNSPFWFRGYYQHEMNETIVDAALKHFDVNTIVTGHTLMERVTPFFNGKVINIDTNHAENNSEALLIRKRWYFRINHEGKREKLK